MLLFLTADCSSEGKFEEGEEEAEEVEEFVDFQSCLLMYGIDFELRNEVE